MSLSVNEFLKHILDEINFLEQSSKGLDFSKFVPDGKTTRAFIRSLEIIGEASKKIPDDFRKKHKDIEWRSIAGMRDKLIHNYFGVDFELVWDVIKNKLPKLKKKIEKILKD